MKLSTRREPDGRSEVGSLHSSDESGYFRYAAIGCRGKKLKVYKEPQIGDYIWHTDAGWSTMKVIGVIGDEWYHVWFPATGEYGFVRQSDLTEGNG